MALCTYAVWSTFAEQPEKKVCRYLTRDEAENAVAELTRLYPGERHWIIECPLKEYSITLEVHEKDDAVKARPITEESEP
jgi:hypothetical protein